MIFNICFEITALLILLVITISFYMTRSFPGRKARHFKTYLWIAILDVSSNLISSVMISFAYSVPLWLNILTNEIFYLSQLAMSIIIVLYSMLLCGLLEGKSSPLVKINVIANLIVAFLIILNPLTKMFFSFDSELVYHRGQGLPFLLGWVGLNLIQALLIAIICRKRKNSSLSPASIVIFDFIVFAFVFIQSMHPELLLSGLSIAFGTFIIFFHLQRPQEQKDPLTKTYTRKAFFEYCAEILSKHKSYPIIFADIKNTSAFNKTFGESNGNLLIKNVAIRLMKKSRKNLVFRYAGDSFMVVVLDKKPLPVILEELSRFRKHDIVLGGVTYDIPIQTFCFTQIKQMESTSDLFTVLEYSIGQCKQTNCEPLVITRKIIEEARRQEKVESIIAHAKENDSLKVALQPIYDVRKMQTSHAMAVSYLYDEEIGIIHKSEFFPIAEKTGLLTALHQQMLNSVCEFLGENQDKPEFRFKTITVILTSSDCMNPDLASYIINLIEKYNVRPSMLVFEISETMATLSVTLKDNMEILSKLGIGFSCGGFGTGYANLDAVGKLPFSTAKLGHSIIEMISNEKEKTIITHLISLLAELGLQTIVEGISNEKEAKFAIAAGACFLESSYLFKPIRIS